MPEGGEMQEFDLENQNGRRKFSDMSMFEQEQAKSVLGPQRGNHSKSGSRALEIARNSRMLNSNTGTNTLLLKALMVPGQKVGHQAVGSQRSGSQLHVPGQSSGMGNFSRSGSRHSGSRHSRSGGSRSRSRQNGQRVAGSRSRSQQQQA